MVPGACGIRTVWRHVRTALFASAGGPALSAVAAGIRRDGRFPGQHRDLRAPLRAALRPQPPPRALAPAVFWGYAAECGCIFLFFTFRHFFWYTILRDRPVRWQQRAAPASLVGPGFLWLKSSSLLTDSICTTRWTTATQFQNIIA